MKYEYIGRGNLYHKRIKIKTTCIDLYYFGFGKLLCWLEIVKLCFVYIITSAGNTISLFKLSLGNTITVGNTDTTTGGSNEFVCGDAGQSYIFV